MFDFDIDWVEDVCVCIENYEVSHSELKCKTGDQFNFVYFNPSNEAIIGDAPWDGHYIIYEPDEKDIVGRHVYLDEEGFWLHFKKTHFVLKKGFGILQ